MLCWNRLPLSRVCLASYLETISVPHELFVIDNGSIDETANWLEEIAGLPGVTDVISQSRNDPAAALNLGLSRCSGRFVHLMENDYRYRPGWDRYIIDRFDRIPELGQLALFEGDARFHRGSHKGLVWLAAENVCTTSVLRRELYAGQGIRVHGHYLGNCYPDDHDLSTQVREAGWLVAWPDRDLARNVGFENTEYGRDPGYYVRNYALKLFSVARLRGNLRHWLKLDFHDTLTLVGRLARACCLKLRRLIRPG
ncbi:glycosyltransferase [Wenzhouxiangellaceae bacterium CH-27]|uniref:Glycosyltransferase n=2 Tax=Elongatibacter sediminis TaxID=3119006 RepID=A0AAW9R533_9GAMM